jgi:pimeloyl-ACP methyl ester carboxylesterase
MRKSAGWLKAGIIAVVFIAGLAVVYRIQDPEKRQLDAATRAGLPGQFIQLQEGMTHYTLSGPPGGQVVVLVHGFSVAAYSWDRNIPALTKAGFRVLAYDLYGRGYSDRPQGPYTLQRFTDQLDQLLTALQIDQPVDIVGISMGGYVTAGYADRHPDRVRRIALLAPQVESMGSDPRLSPLAVPGLGDYLFTVYIGPYVMADSKDEFKDYMASSDWHERYLDMMAYQGFRRAILSTLRDMPGDPFIEYRQLGQTKTPVLLLWGDKDTTIPIENAQLVREAVPQADYHIIQGARHASIYERPELVNPLLVNFLRQP